MKDRDRRIKALEKFIRAYEVEHGEITGAEISEARRRARARAVVIRPSAPRTPRRKRGAA